MHLNKYTRMTEDNKQNEHKEEIKKPQDHSGVMMTGHIKIFDPETGEVMLDDAIAGASAEFDDATRNGAPEGGG